MIFFLFLSCVPIMVIQGVPKNCENPAHTKPLFWKYFLDVQGVGTYLLSEVKKRKTVNSYVFITTVFQNAKCFYYFLNTIKGDVRQYDLLEHVKQDNNRIIICHYSVCV